MGAVDSRLVVMVGYGVAQSCSVVSAMGQSCGQGWTKCSWTGGSWVRPPKQDLPTSAKWYVCFRRADRVTTQLLGCNFHVGSKRAGGLAVCGLSLLLGLL
eukprot:scaffold145039_cov19-Prasinocladus_malaysianus.AAC.1